LLKFSVQNKPESDGAPEADSPAGCTSFAIPTGKTKAVLPNFLTGPSTKLLLLDTVFAFAPTLKINGLVALE